MDSLNTIIALIPFAAAVFAGTLFVVVWPNRRRPTAAAVLCLVGACGIWAFFYGIEIAIEDFRLKVVAAQLQYIGIAFVAPSWCVAAVHSSGFSRKFSSRQLGLSLIIPSATVAAALSSSLHNLLWRDVSVRSEVPYALLFAHGPIFFVNVLYAWLLLAIGTVLLLHNFATSHRLFLGQRLLLVLTMALPWLANVAYIFNLGPIHGLDFTPCAFVLSAFILFFGIIRYRIPNIVPIAREFVVENFNDALFVIDNDNTLIDVNRAGRKLFGESESPLIGTDANESLSRITALARILQSEPAGAMSFETTSGQGKQTYEARIDTLSMNPEVPLGRVVTCRDITREVDANAQLEERENRYRVLFEESPIALWVEDFSEVRAFFDEGRKNGVADWRAYFEENSGAVRECANRVRILDVNLQAVAQHCARDKGDVIANLPATFTSNSFDVFREELICLAQGNTSFHSEAELKTLSGDALWASVNVRVVPGYEERLERVLVSNIDISERKRAEERRLHLERQIQESQKLESLGVLAGGIAHDFNNILVAIVGNASLVLTDLNPASPYYENVREIEGAAHRAAELCRQMLAYAGKGKFAVRRTDLGAVVRSMMPLLLTSVSKKAAVHFDVAPQTRSIEADATQIEQVVMNLVINASESLYENPGTITISIGTEHYSPDQMIALPHSDTLTDGMYTYLEVADTGCGMDKLTVARIFEPFFSTKFAGRGLGMSVVLGIVRGHNGTLDVQTDVGKGTTIRVLFPAASNGVTAPAPVIRKSAYVPFTATASVLVIDDEDGVRSVCAKMLERLGVSVLTAIDGRNAVEVFKSRQDDIDLVLLDFKMPQLDGIETFHLLRQISPKVKVVLSSGYTEEEIAAQCHNLGFAGFIQKPYTLEMLESRLIPLLGARQ